MSPKEQNSELIRAGLKCFCRLDIIEIFCIRNIDFKFKVIWLLGIKYSRLVYTVFTLQTLRA